MTRPHHGLKVWREAMALARDIYGLTARFPAQERYGLTAQLRRAAVSVPSNVAEGAARGSRKESIHFPHVARGSLSEVDTQCRLTHDFGYGDATAVLVKIESLFGLLAGLIRTQRNQTDSSQAAKLLTDKPRSG